MASCLGNDGEEAIHSFFEVTKDDHQRSSETDKKGKGVFGEGLYNVSTRPADCA